jgi:tRNA-dihydrouridine synthase A
MMQRTDRHFRYLMRTLAPHVRLYTEMIPARAIVRGERRDLLRFDVTEHPVAAQLGGCEPDELAQAARVCAEFGYDEVNLNCGCPSARVQAATFGAALMATPGRVAECVAAMRNALPATVEITVKCRLGIDHLYDYDYFAGFVDTISAAGCRAILVHARKAWLNGLSPRENRELPRLEYGWVHRLKRERPDLVVVINGGIGAVASARTQLAHVDGVMIGRAAYAEPMLIATLDRLCASNLKPVPELSEIVERYSAYVARELASGTPLTHLTRHLANLLHGRPHSRVWRQHLAAASTQPGADATLVGAALRAFTARTAQAARAATAGGMHAPWRGHKRSAYTVRD